MSQLTADISRKYKLNPDVRLEIQAAAATTVYMNSAVGVSSGYGRQLVAGDVFAGFANGPVNNVANALRPNEAGVNGILIGSAGGLNIELRASGIVELSAITGASAVTDIGSSVYMSDGNTFTLTSTSNTLIGKISYFLNGVFGVSFKSGLLS